jgi:hypothetical protein
MMKATINYYRNDKDRSISSEYHVNPDNVKLLLLRRLYLSPTSMLPVVDYAIVEYSGKQYRIERDGNGGYIRTEI